MTNADLAQFIRDHFTPFAFTCECNGAMYECQDAMENPYLVGVVDTVRRIADYIEKS